MQQNLNNDYLCYMYIMKLFCANETKYLSNISLAVALPLYAATENVLNRKLHLIGIYSVLIKYIPLLFLDFPELFSFNLSLFLSCQPC
jgi:hypothetical protein